MIYVASNVGDIAGYIIGASVLAVIALILVGLLVMHGINVARLNRNSLPEEVRMNAHREFAAEMRRREKRWPIRHGRERSRPHWTWLILAAVPVSFIAFAAVRIWSEA
jgi:H+/Cl- antiporter ClcA